MASVRLVGVGSATHCGGGYEIWGRCSGLCSCVRRGPSKPLWWRARLLSELLWPVFPQSAWAQPATVVAVTKGEDASMASVRLVGVGWATRCGGGYDMRGRCSGLCSRVRCGPRKPMWWRSRLLSELLWPLFSPSAWAQPAYVLAGTTCEVAALASVLSVGVGSASICVGWHDMWGRCSGLCSRGPSKPFWWLVRQVMALMWPLFSRSAWAQPPLWWREIQVMALLWPLFDRSAWAQPATVEVGKAGEGTALASGRSVSVGSKRHCGGGHYRWGSWSGHCSLAGRGFSQPLWWRARQVRVLHWPLFARSAWAQLATVVAGPTVESAALASVPSIGVGSKRHLVEGAASAFVRSLAVGSPSLCWRARQVRALLWPLFAWSAWAQPPLWWREIQVMALLWPLLIGRRGLASHWWRAGQMRSMLWPLFARLVWSQPATVVAGTAGEGVALASVCSFGVVEASHCGGVHDRWGRCSGLCSIGRRGLSQPLWWRARQVRALFWPLFARWAWAHTAYVLAGKTGEGGALTFVRLFGLVWGSHCGGGHDGWWRWYGLFSLDQREPIYPLWWRARQVRALLWPLFDQSASAQPATVEAGMTGEGAALACVYSVSVGSANHCGGGPDSWGRCSGLCSLGRRGLKTALWWRAWQVRALLWPVFARSAWAQLTTVVAGPTGEGAALASVRSLAVGSTSHCCGGQEMWGRFSGLCSLGRHGLRQPLWWRARQVRTLLWPLIAWSAWAQPATVVAGTTGEGSALASVWSVDVGSASHWWRARQMRAMLWPLFARSAWSQPATVVAGTAGEGVALASVRSVGVFPWRWSGTWPKHVGLINLLIKVFLIVNVH
jgi:hypothetical protein